MSDTPTSGPMLAADGTPLKVSLARALRREKIKNFLLVAPLLFFVLVAFIAPIGDMLVRSVDNSIVPKVLPTTTELLQEWDPAEEELPSETVFKSLVLDIQQSELNKKSKDSAQKLIIPTRVASRLNYEFPQMRKLIVGTTRKVKRLKEVDSYKEELIKINKEWANPDTWKAIKLFSGEYTLGYLLGTVDLKQGLDGGIESKPADERIHLYLFVRTMIFSVIITFCTVLLGYPIAYLLANIPLRYSNLLMILVLLPFWTSLLVRTSSWIVLLQQQGVINNFLVAVGIIGDDGRLSLIFNETGTVIAMTHILLPFMILPLYSVMRTIPPTYVRAAKSMGATDFTAFRRVYFPNTIPGIGAGGILVFILSIGYYITPELVGGTNGVFISSRIAYHINTSLNWGLAAALALVLLGIVLIFYYFYDRIVGIDNVKLG